MYIYFKVNEPYGANGRCRKDIAYANPLRASAHLSHQHFAASLRKHSFKERERERDMARSDSSFKIILGSSSMARREILADMGYEFTIVTADIDEKSIRKERPEELVMALAEAKADAIISRLQSTDQFKEDDHATLLITADTVCFSSLADLGLFLIAKSNDIEVVVYEGKIREKPSDREEAREFIKGYSGSHAAVVGSILVSNLKTGTRKGGWDRAEVGWGGRGVCPVYFHDIPDEVIDNLIEEGITLNVAGGLMLEHPLTLPFVEAVVCSLSLSLYIYIYICVGEADTVMGLSKALTEKLMKQAL
ncbi:hypothetical protein JRO89_XS08G0154500 [Xanthoceras sorbifolium]|uniref:Maf-like protein n=1 Tax=Xanthoceras sorbifolium TaxID=99658 RepID=A0ABQ8HPX2_9ROSI|nr:hypothetical protein JRO89_XS08G0154500 [Xanthoceras sorbifolium]